MKFSLFRRNLEWQYKAKIKDLNFPRNENVGRGEFHWWPNDSFSERGGRLLGAISRNEKGSIVPYVIRFFHHANVAGKTAHEALLVPSIQTKLALAAALKINLFTWWKTCIRVVPCLDHK